MEEIPWSELIPFHQLRCASVEQSKSAARNQPRHVTQQPLIENLGLSKISQLSGSADICRSGEHVILHHRPKQGIWRELFGAVGKLFGRIAKISNRNTLSAIQQE